MSDYAVRHRVVGVFPNRAQAERAGRKAAEAGAQAQSVAIDDHDDEQRSLLAEMQQEMDSTAAGPLTIAIPGPAKKAMYAVVPAAAVAGAVLGVLAALLPIGSWSMVMRMVVYGLVGAAAVSLIAFLVNGIAAPSGPEANAAADRGVVVGADAPGGALPAVVEVMKAEGAIRLDVVDLGGVGHPVVGDADPAVPEALRQSGERLSRERKNDR